MHDSIQAAVDGLDAHGSLLQRPLHTPAQLVFIERFTDAIAFDDPRHDKLSGLKSGVALAAGLTFPAPAHRVALCYQTRINDFGVISTTERTMQSQPRWAYAW